MIKQNHLNKKMSKLRFDSGFTLAETLIVVGIILVLAAFGFVNVVGYRRQLHLRENDDIARQIFLAAQNHLTAAEASGAWDYEKILEDSKKGTTWFGEVNGSHASYEGIEGQTEKDGAKVLHDWRYIVARDGKVAGNGAEALNIILPFGAVDETIRGHRQFIVLYDAKTATINGVFYTDGITDELTFESATALYTSYIYPNENRGTRRTQISRTTVVGWYGPGETEAADDSGLKRPIVTVENKEALALEIVNPNNNNSIVNPDATNTTQIKLVFTGENGGSAEITLPIIATDSSTDDLNKGRFAQNIKDQTTFEAKLERLWTGRMNTGNWYYKIYLDSICLEGAHFAEIFGPKGFIPGDNITIAVSVVQNGKESKATEVTTNSLFGTLDGSSAMVLNGRHLQNLDPEVSNLDVSTDKVKVETADIRDTIIWKDGQDQGDFFSNYKKLQYPLQNDAALNVVKCQVSGTAETIPGSAFYSIKNDKLTTINGNMNRLINFDLAENAAGGAGLVGQTAKGTELKVQNLAMVNVKADATGTSDAGALVGTANDELTIDSCAVYTAAYDSTAKDWTDFTGSDLMTGIKAAGGSAGGLVGKMGDGGEIRSSMAGLYISGKDAGGLVGTAGGTSNITNSYAAGHTAGYKDADIDLIGWYEDVTTETVRGRYNVIATGGAAGGLVGSAVSKVEIENSYATASAYGTTDAGGMIGYLVDNSSTIKNSYCTGRIGGTEEVLKGAFIGDGIYNAKSSDGNLYFEIINNDMRPLGVLSVTDENPVGLTAIDADLDAYNSFVSFTADDGGANPYDGGLSTLYGDRYALKTIAQLGGMTDADKAAAPDWIVNHYGDWPAPETLVVNIS